MKEIHLIVPEPIHRAWKRVFPYRGEMTIFVRRCMEYAILHGKPPVNTPEEMHKIILETHRESQQD